MKKFAILTSLLALTACGGGSHHPSERVRTSPTPTYEPSYTYMLTNESTRKSNSNVTSMVSEIDICEESSSPRPNTGRKSTIERGNDKFTVYDLSDVTFTMADESALEPGDKSFEFVIDNTNDKGKIIGINMLFKEEEKPVQNWRQIDEKHPEHGETKDVNADWVHKQKNVFNGYVKHDGKNSINGYTNSNIKFVSMGVGDENHDGLGLKYSDFGYFDVTVKENWKPVFIGGYDVRKINPEEIDNKDDKKVEYALEFAGHAVGYLAAFHSGTDEAKTKSLDTTATLTFKEKESHLVADFSNNDWYKMDYTEKYDASGNVSTRNVKFTGDLDDNTFAFSKKSFDQNDTYQEYEDRDDPAGTYNTVESDVRYFGDGKKPTEAVGIIQVRDCAGGECGDFDVPKQRNDEVRMNLSFGVKLPEK